LVGYTVVTLPAGSAAAEGGAASLFLELRG